MASVSTYLNFDKKTEEAFEFYKGIFGTDYLGEINRMGDVAGVPDMPPIPDDEKKLIMHISLPILAGHVLHGTDIMESAGHVYKPGNNSSINLETDTLEETQRLFDGLSDEASEVFPLQEMFWGATWGTLTDKYSIQWMFNCQPTA